MRRRRESGDAHRFCEAKLGCAYPEVRVYFTHAKSHAKTLLTYCIFSRGGAFLRNALPWAGIFNRFAVSMSLRGRVDEFSYVPAVVISSRIHEIATPDKFKTINVPARDDIKYSRRAGPPANHNIALRGSKLKTVIHGGQARPLNVYCASRINAILESRNSILETSLPPTLDRLMSYLT